MNRAETRELAADCRARLTADDAQAALALLLPAVSSRTSFALLDLCGRLVAESAARSAGAFTVLLDSLAATHEIGAWPLIGSALAAAYLSHDVPHALAEARRYILQAEVWHATDAIAERVPGEALRRDFETTLALLEGWRTEPSPWLRRATGVAVHLYTKREREQPQRVSRLLDLLEPLLEERETSAVKGVGWGLKTIGRFYPDLLTPWLRNQLASKNPRRPMVRKATAYLEWSED